MYGFSAKTLDISAESKTAVVIKNISIHIKNIASVTTDRSDVSATFYSIPSITRIFSLSKCICFTLSTNHRFLQIEALQNQLQILR